MSGERFSERHDDLVWRVHCGDQWLYLYLLLEFQSGLDRRMALRMQVYIGSTPNRGAKSRQHGVIF